MKRSSCGLALFAILLLPALSCAQSDSGAERAGVLSGDEPLPSYWLRNREAWFWYQDPPITPKPAAPKTPETDRRPRELVEFEAMQKRLEELKRIAVMNPT